MNRHTATIHALIDRALRFKRPQSTEHDRRRIAWGICCAITGLVFLFYTGVSLHSGYGDIVMPLDDAYIHFQYARQLAQGHPFVYNPGDPPTSGATSLIYPFILAVGYLLGFKGLSLGLWAMGAGALAMLASMWLIYLSARALSISGALSLCFAALFALTGPVSWHSMSGMETGLMMAFTLGTFYMMLCRSATGCAVFAGLLALSRPEGGIMAVIAAGFMLFHPSAQDSRRARPLWRLSRPIPVILALPILAVCVQPVLNFLMTGSFFAAGNQAKSIFGMVPFSWEVVTERIWENLIRMWRELATGDGGYYVPRLIPLLALVGWARLAENRANRPVAVALLAWYVAMTAAVSTLDTAFWHFRRYQMPLLGLLFPLAALGMDALIRLDTRRIMSMLQPLVKKRDWLRARIHRLAPLIFRPARFIVLSAVALSISGSGLLAGVEFLRLYRVNVANVAVQPLAMARWLAANTPEDAVIAVHDVGMMRYIGERMTIDMVGLTTPGAADAWRNGPGAVAEFLMHHQPQPDYVAAYTTARGLNYLVESGLYGRLLAGFPAEYNPADNVALAAEFQGIYEVDWADIIGARPPSPYGSVPTGLEAGAFQEIDVGHLASERDANYRWQNHAGSPGFPTEVYRLNYAGCSIESCRVTDGGRRLNGDESFDLRPVLEPGQPAGDVLLLTRLHPVYAGTIDIFANDQHVATRWIPSIPGYWLDVATVIPAALANSGPTRIRIVPHISGGYYMPYAHWVYMSPAPRFIDAEPLAAFQNGAVQLMSASLNVIQRSLAVRFTWQSAGGAQGDYRLFVHVYGAIDEPPVAQTDMYPVNGTLPPGNWLSGAFEDTFVVDLTGVPPGSYSVAVGFYDPLTFDRLMPALHAPGNGIWVDEPERRLFIGEVEIP